MPGLLELSLCRHVVCDEREVEQAKVGCGRHSGMVDDAVAVARLGPRPVDRPSHGHVDGTGPMYSYHASPRARGMLYGPESSCQSYLRNAGSMAARDKAMVTMIISATDRTVDRILSDARSRGGGPAHGTTTQDGLSLNGHAVCGSDMEARLQDRAACSRPLVMHGCGILIWSIRSTDARWAIDLRLRCLP